MDLFGQASWVMFAAGAVTTGLAAYLAWRRLAGRFAPAQDDMRRALEEANAGLARERARIETLVGHISDVLVITNLRGEVLFLNAAALPLFGASHEDMLAGGKSLLQPRDPSCWRLRVQDILKAHTSGGVMDLPAAAGGRPMSFRTTVTMFSDPMTGDFGVLMLLRDQTSEKRIEALKEEFFQAAAHDLRAPLFAVEGYLRLLKKSIEPDERQRSWLEAIDQSCERLTALVKDVLDSARIESGQLKLLLAAVQPVGVLRRAVRLFQPMADERGVRLEMGLIEGAPPSFEADERLVERLIHNLIANAIKFTPNGGRVLIEAGSVGADRVEFVVTDTGPGIPEERRAAVFEKFRQFDSDRAKSGFGLGLAICAKIVKLHKGEIWVQTAQTGGARFVVRLPLVQIAQEVLQT